LPGVREAIEKGDPAEAREMARLMWQGLERARELLARAMVNLVRANGGCCVDERVALPARRHLLPQLLEPVEDEADPRDRGGSRGVAPTQAGLGAPPMNWSAGRQPSCRYSGGTTTIHQYPTPRPV